MRVTKGVIAGAIAAASTLAVAPMAQAATLRITVDNLAPDNGTALTPAWFGFHNGDFDLYDRGVEASFGLERLAEDGTIDDLNDEFTNFGAGTVQGAVLDMVDPPIRPGESTSITVEVDANALSSRYFSYAAMVLPSNDFFIANGNPLAHQIFDDEGNFLGADFTITGAQVLDAGTEVNDELEATTAFFGQSVDDTGTPEGGTVQLASDVGEGGFIPGGRILSAPQFENADFSRIPGYEVARFRVELVDAESVPEPGVVLGLLAMGGLMIKRHRQQEA